MQTADERNGSSNTTIISTTISSTSNENDNHSNDTMTQHHQHLPQAQPIHQHHHQPPGNNETTTPANVLRHRSITSNTRTANKSDLWHLIDAAECLSSNVECIPATPRTSTSVTPSTSPQASPARTNKLKQDLLKLATAGGVGMHSIVISAPLQKNTYKANTSLEPRSSSSSLSLLASSKTVSNSTPTSTTSSVIATPILKRNGDIFNSNNEQSEVANDKGQANDENTKNPVRATAAEAYDPEGIVVSESNDMQLDKNKSKIIPVENDKTADYCKQFRESNNKQQLLTNQKLPYENISPTETINKELSSNTLPVSSSTTSLSITTLCVTDANQQPSASSSLTSSSTASTASVTPVSAAATPALLSTTSSSSSSTSLSATPSSTTDSNIKGFQLSGLVEAELLHWQDMPEYLQFNPYVLRGYRPLTTFKGCLLSLFYWHNETINILTHAIPIVYILAIVPGLMPWESGYRFLSFCHVFGAVAPWCGSFVYHLFMNIEQGENVYNRLLKLDMVGIWVSQSFGALPLVTASTFCFTFKWKWFIIISYCLLSLWGLYKALTASSPWQRRLCFGLPFAMRSVLTFFRTIGLVGGNRVALEHVFLQDGVSIFGGAIGAMRIPEKWFPGLVDFYLNSHNIMHVLVVVAVYSMYKATMKDFEWMETANCDVFVNITSKVIESTLNTKVEL